MVDSDYMIEHLVNKFILPDGQIVNYCIYRDKLLEAARKIHQQIPPVHEIALEEVAEWLSDVIEKEWAATAQSDNAQALVTTAG